MFPHCFPLWIADPAANPVYFSRRMRQNLGLSLESHSLGNLRWASLIADGVFEPVIPGPGEIKATCREYRLADGSTETMLTYVRELRFNGSLVGYIGSTMPLKEGATRSMEPRMPAARVPSATVRLGIDLYGVAMNHVDAYAKALHPILSIRSSDECDDLARFRRELGELCYTPDLPVNPICPSDDFLFTVQPFDDFNFALLEQFACIKQVAPVYMTKTLTQMDGNTPEPHAVDMKMWLNNQGANIYELDLSGLPKQQRIRNCRVDFFLEDDPEDWLLLNFLGYPTMLMDRPWNQGIRTRLRVRSVETALQMIGVEPDQTYSDYDPRLMSDPEHLPTAA